MIIKLDYTNIKNFCFSKIASREYGGHSNVSLRFLFNEEFLASPADLLVASSCQVLQVLSQLQRFSLPKTMPLSGMAHS